ncbi:MAG: ABC transporter substrate-binding protein [bacterium]
MRKVVLISAILAIAVLALGLASPAQMKYKEAPMLAELVRAGKLPPVEQRLPKEPLVVEPVEKIGQYGGTWRRVMTRFQDTRIGDRMGYEPPVRWARDGKTVVPNLFKSWDVTEGGKVFTFHIREGVKWSDGQPYTADDVMFWYEDVLLNKDITPSFPTWLMTGGEPVKISKKDDYTVEFRFKEPHGLLLEFLAFQGYTATFYPKHYLKQFHPRYTDKEKLDRMAKEREFEFWHQLFSNKASLYENPELPSLRPWVLQTAPPATVATAVRNPYYWKVDTAGNQLPYIDKVVWTLVENPEVANLKAMAGEVDMQSRYMKSSNYTVFKMNAEKGNYQVRKWIGPVGICLYPNQNAKDPVLRKLIEDKKFRQALSVAINREEIIELTFLGLVKPSRTVSSPWDPYYLPEFDQKYIEYDPDEANRLLDEIGLTKRDSEGYRLRPDGKTLSLTINAYEMETAGGTDVWELVVDYWNKIGIKTSLKVEARELWTQRTTAGEHEVAGYAIAGIHWVIDPLWYVPTSQYTYWAPLYGIWYATGGKGGEEPRGDLRRLQLLYDELKSTVDEKKKLELGRQILSMHAENSWIIGITREAAIAIVKNNFKNVPEDVIQDWRLISPGYVNPEQFYIEQ